MGPLPETEERCPLHTGGAANHSPTAGMPEPGDTRRWAIATARRGWPVFPCLPGSKRPAVDRWEARATADADRVARYWRDRHNIGVACGPARLVVVDLDSAAHGELPEDWRLPGVNDGLDVLALLCQWAAQPWPATYTVQTPAGGWHLYFRAPDGMALRNTAGKLGPLIDTRASGGYVLAAGSVVDGRAYQEIDTTDPVPLPSWLAQMLAASPARPAAGRPVSPNGNRRLAALCHVVARAPEGQRNQTLYWAACRAVEAATARQADPAVLTEALVSAAAAAGLPEAEARRTIASGMNGGDR